MLQVRGGGRQPSLPSTFIPIQPRSFIPIFQCVFGRAKVSFFLAQSPGDPEPDWQGKGRLYFFYSLIFSCVIFCAWLAREKLGKISHCECMGYFLCAIGNRSWVLSPLRSLLFFTCRIGHIKGCKFKWNVTFLCLNACQKSFHAGGKSFVRDWSHFAGQPRAVPFLCIFRQGKVCFSTSIIGQVTFLCKTANLKKTQFLISI